MAKDKSGDQETGGTVVKGAALDQLTATIATLEKRVIELCWERDTATAQARKFSDTAVDLQAKLEEAGAPARSLIGMEPLVDMLALLNRLWAGEEDQDVEQARLLATVAFHLELERMVANLLPVDPDRIAEYVRAVMSPPKPEPSR